MKTLPLLFVVLASTLPSARASFEPMPFAEAQAKYREETTRIAALQQDYEIALASLRSRMQVEIDDARARKAACADFDCAQAAERRIQELQAIADLRKCEPSSPSAEACGRRSHVENERRASRRWLKQLALAAFRYEATEILRDAKAVSNVRLGDWSACTRVFYDEGSSYYRQPGSPFGQWKNPDLHPACARVTVDFKAGGEFVRTELTVATAANGWERAFAADLADFTRQFSRDVARLRKGSRHLSWHAERYAHGFNLGFYDASEPKLTEGATFVRHDLEGRIAHRFRLVETAGE